MIERYLRYLKLLDNFKEQDIARFIENLREKALVTLRGPYFSDKTKPFFRNINAEGEPFSNFDTEPKQIVQIKQLLNALYHAQLAFEDLQSVNLRDGSNKIQDAKKLYYKTIEHGYKASYLLTHLDIDFNEVLGSDLQQVIQLLSLVKDLADPTKNGSVEFDNALKNYPILAPIKAFADAHKEGAVAFTSALKNYPIGHQAGLVSGIAIAQMKPNEGNFDYDFLAHFGAVLPGYIQQLTVYLHQYGPQISTYQPTIDKAKLDELQEQAFKLLKSIENLQSGDIFLSFKALNYIRIIREIISLSMSSLEQIGYANDSSQQVIRHNMRHLKYNLLPTLLGIADHLEDQALLHPGTLSQPLLTHLKPYYELMGIYASKIVDFSVEGEELLTIEDAHFVDKRLEPTRQRIAAAKWNLEKQQVAQTAFTTFFSIIEDPKYAKYSLLNLPSSEKETLKKSYQLLLPYAKLADPELANLITTNLTEENTYTRQLVRPWHWLRGFEGPIATTSLSAFKMKLQAELSKDVTTQQFHIGLNEDIIKSTEERAQVSIFPYKNRPQLSGFNEAKVLGVDPSLEAQQHLQFIRDPENTWVGNETALTFEQSIVLAQYHEKKCLQLKEAQAALQEFLEIIIDRKQNPAVEIDEIKLKAKLRHLYSRFQPYLLENMVDVKKAIEQDRAIVDSLTEKPLLAANESKAIDTIDCFTEKNIVPVLAHFECLIALCNARAESFTQLTKQKYIHKVQAQNLTPDTRIIERANFLLKHTDYSKAVAAYRVSLSQLTNVFNKTLKQKLQPAPNGLPFPEVEDNNLILVETKQALAIKRIFNSLYHLEQICIELEKLDQKSTQSVYVYHLIQAKAHVDELFIHAKELTFDPHFTLLATELKDKAIHFYNTFVQQKDTYVVDSNAIDLQDARYKDKKVKYSGLWYTLHTFMLVPEHIKAAVRSNELSIETKDAVNIRTKQAALNIEGIIENSNSYFKLFLETPTIYRLYKELKGKLNEFTHLSHSAAIEHLDELNNDLFVRILTEADEVEDKLGLKPGLLADPMKALLDEFHQGFLEPLGLNSQEHLTLLSTLAPITHRIEATKIRQQAAKEMLLPAANAVRPHIGLSDLDTDKYALSKISFADKDALIKVFLAEVDIYLNLTRGLPATPLVLALCEERMLKLYTAALPILLQEKKQFKLSSEPVESKYQKIEEFLQKNVIPPAPVEETVTESLPLFVADDNSPIEIEMTEFVSDANRISSSSGNIKAKDEPAITNIIQVANAVLKHYQGINNSVQFDVATAQERITYLEGLKIKQEEASLKFRHEYTVKAFERELKLLTSRYIGLLHTRDEYNQVLKDYLNTTAVQVIEQSECAQDINAEIKRLLVAQTKEFDRLNFPKYSQLDAVRTAIAQFDGYFGKTNQAIQRGSSFFESEATLANKVEIIDRLREKALSKRPVEERLAEIKEEVGKTSFKITMHAYHHYDTFSFAWIGQCIISLLSALHLYTPKHKVLTERLEKAVETPAQTRALRRFSLFAPLNSNVRAYDLPPPVIPGIGEEPVNPVVP